MSPKDWFAVVIASLTFGFSYGISNQNSYLIHGLASLDSNFLKNDWLVRQTESYHSGFGYLIELFGRFGLLPWTLAIINYSLIAISLVFVWRILRATTDNDSTVAFFGVLAIIVFDKTVNAADTYIYAQYLQPSSIASFIFILSLYFFIQGDFLRSGLIQAVSGLFHLNFLILGLAFFRSSTFNSVL